MVSKWCLSFTSSYVFGEDKKLYRLPYTSGKKERCYREIKKQYPNRYRINNKWWSEKQLKKHLILDQVPYLIKPIINNYPF